MELSRRKELLRMAGYSDDESEPSSGDSTSGITMSRVRRSELLALSGFPDDRPDPNIIAEEEFPISGVRMSRERRSKLLSLGGIHPDEQLTDLRFLAERFGVNASWLQRQAEAKMFPTTGAAKLAKPADVQAFIDEIQRAMAQDHRDAEAEQRKRIGALAWHEQRQEQLRNAAKTMHE